MKHNILDLSKEQLTDWAVQNGLPKYSAAQIIEWLYKKRVDGFEAMTNLSKKTKSLLAEHFHLGRLEITDRHVSPTDRSTKFLLKLADGREIESISMPQKNRLTLCISSQVGCAMGCRFCRTASMKLLRNLTQGEILGQILAAESEIKPPEKITNIVMMGMGEPFHNFDTVIAALKIMTDPNALALSQRRITVSTVGLAPEIERFGKESGVKLALSLNATTEEGRKALMPVTNKYSLERVIEACKTYTKLRPNRKVTFEYVMMAGVNDSMEDAKRLAQIGSQVPCKINLIPYNAFPTSPYKRPSEKSVRDFFEYLAGKNFQVNIRYSKGLDVMGACGQLATPIEKCF